jgi:uncharacterized membrane protein
MSSGYTTTFPRSGLTRTRTARARGLHLMEGDMYTVTTLPGGPQPGPLPVARAFGLNKSGDVVGYVNYEAAIWYYNAAPLYTPQPFDELAGWYDINDKGSAVGSLDGAMLFQNGALENLSTLPGAGNSTAAYGINNSGLVCASNGFGEGGLIIDTKMMTVSTLNFPNIGDAPVALTINDAGDLAGSCVVNGDASHGFLCRGGVCLDLGPNCGGFKLNNQGRLVGSQSADAAGPIMPAMWEWKTPQSIPTQVMVPPPPGFSEGAFLGLNDLGVMVGMAFNNDNNEQTAFISTDGMTSTNLNSQIGDPSWVLSEAHAINSAGQIAGAGYLNGVQTGFLLTPLPTPAPWQSVQIDALLELIYVSLGVMVDGGGPTSGGPVDPWSPLAATGEAALGLAINAVASRVSDAVGRDALRGAALEMTRRSVDRLIAQAKAPAPRPMPPQQGGGLRGRLGRMRFARSPRGPENASKT